MKQPLYFTWIPSPIEPLLLMSDGEALTGLHMTDGRHVPPHEAHWQERADVPVFDQTRRELDEYFAGRLREFSVPLRLIGTPFQLAAWEALQRIPYGQLRSYGEQARLIERPKAVRAVGAANGRNPVSIIVPCHRVIGSNGSLTGYGGGLANKDYLLRLEGALL